MPNTGDLNFPRRAAGYGDRCALIAPDGVATYADLLQKSEAWAATLRAVLPSLPGERIAYLIPPSINHVAVQWGIWRAGGIAVPLAMSYPAAEWEHILRDAGASIVVTHPALRDKLGPAVPSVCQILTGPAQPAVPTVPAVPVPPDSPALMIYTSGTTGQPKGVVTTHANIDAQVTSLHEAWGWTRDDRVLLALPLHHVHGIVNVVCCALWAGACCEMADRFDPAGTWERLASGEVTLFMAVPTMYRKLIEVWENAGPPARTRWSEGCRSIRLIVSGSAALPVAIHEQWESITGHVLLERYGMTEVGMALSNPLRGERRAGTVGQPLPGVDVRLVAEHAREADQGANPGEIQIRGPTVFREYWRRPEETAAAFDGGWFKTGDIAVFEEGYYRILGRSSVDIIKSGGYKISALEIEEVCRTHPGIAECAVVGIEDDEWGERICIAIEVHGEAALEIGEFRAWAKTRLAPYKIPRRLRLVDGLPRNAMGKVTKPDVKKLFMT